MRKIIFVSVIFISCLSKNFAQQKVSLYLSASFGMSKITPVSSDVKARLSSSFGTHLKIKLAKNFDLVAQPALAFRGYENSNAVNDYDIKTTYIDVPLDIEYHFTFGYMKGMHEQDLFFIGAGIYEGLAVSGNYRDKYTNDAAKKLKFGESVVDNRSATDLGMSFVAGLQNEKFRFGLQYEKGIRNVVPKDRQPGNSKINLTNFSFFVAYKLHRKNKR